MPKRTRVPNINLNRDTRPSGLARLGNPADLPANYTDYSPEPLTVRDIRAKRPPIPDRPWTNTVRAPADDLDQNSSA